MSIIDFYISPKIKNRTKMYINQVYRQKDSKQLK